MTSKGEYLGNYKPEDYVGYANAPEYGRKIDKGDKSTNGSIRKRLRALSVALLLGVQGTMYTSCKEDEDPGYEIVDDSVEKEASEYQKQLDKLQATFKAQNEVEAFTAEDRKTIEARFKLIQKLIDLKRTGRQVVSQKEIIPTDGNETMSIDDAITTLLNEVEGFLIGNGWRVY